MSPTSSCKIGNGVVHVGAHRGEEVPGYLLQKRSPIICFEPQILEAHSLGAVEFHRVALGNVRGIFDFYVPFHLQEHEGMDTQSASLLKVIPQRAIDNGWVPPRYMAMTVPVVRFDDWAVEHKFQHDSCDLLRVDVQGFELQVLEGFGNFLTGFHVIVCECSSPPIYKNGYSAEDVVAFLRDKGFTRVSDIQRHGDIRFVRTLE